MKVPASAHATSITYEGREGKQYVAIVSTGGSFLESPVDSDALTVFALPQTPKAAALDDGRSDRGTVSVPGGG